MEKYENFDEDKYIYEKTNEILSFDDIEKSLNSLSVFERVNYLNGLTNNESKNCFFIGD